MGNLIIICIAPIALGVSLSFVYAAPSVTDPCIIIAGKTFVSPADARACLASSPLNDAIRPNVLDIHQKFYTFENYALNNPPPFQESTVDLRAGVAKVSAAHYRVSLG
jgi:hypothetical protein